ncbi:MAG: hypothetical protein M1819_000910 [Sarea resinae]|nr:MAG: hypothetical protein M1819_000910 [Sarea resinae]
MPAPHPSLASASLSGVVVSAGRMTGTVKVRVAQQVWNRHLRKVHPNPNPSQSDPIIPFHPPSPPKQKTKEQGSPNKTDLPHPWRPLQYFPTRTHILVSDPAASTREGDIISLHSGPRVSKTVHHTVASIVSPFGTPIAARPPVPSLLDLLAQRARKRDAKEERRAMRARGEVVESDLIVAEQQAAAGRRSARQGQGKAKPKAQAKGKEAAAAAVKRV